jgi:4-diphosphocytidyl-2C-methyl-D-erythritol kinase
MVLANRKDLDFEISLEKLVPPQAGLGGGSADAAALLELLIELEIVPLEEALAIGETLGSDIPALIGSGLRFVYGRGGRQMFLDFDQNSQIASFLNSPLIIIKPPLGMSTPKAYAMLGLKSELSPRSKQFFLESQSSFFDSGRQEREVRGHTADWLGSLGLGLRAPFGVEDSVADVLTLLGLEGTGGRPFSKGVSKDCSTLLFNEFETVVRNSLEVVDSAFTMLKNVGSHHVMLSGSGSSLVGFFDDEASAERACREIGSIVTDEWFVSLSRFVV